MVELKGSDLQSEVIGGDSRSVVFPALQRALPAGTSNPPLVLLSAPVLHRIGELGGHSGCPWNFGPISAGISQACRSPPGAVTSLLRFGCPAGTVPFAPLSRVPSLTSRTIICTSAVR